jgi:hypothetical protein
LERVANGSFTHRAICETCSIPKMRRLYPITSSAVASRVCFSVSVDHAVPSYEFGMGKFPGNYGLSLFGYACKMFDEAIAMLQGGDLPARTSSIRLFWSFKRRAGLSMLLRLVCLAARGHPGECDCGATRVLHQYTRRNEAWIYALESRARQRLGTRGRRRRYALRLIGLG